MLFIAGVAVPADRSRLSLTRELLDFELDSPGFYQEEGLLLTS